MNKTADECLSVTERMARNAGSSGSQQNHLYKDTNPADYNLNNPAISQDYNINMSGGNDKGTYYAGLGYNRQEGLPIKTFYERYMFCFVMPVIKLTDWLTSSSNFQL